MILMAAVLATGIQAKVELTQARAVAASRDSAASVRIARSRMTESDEKAKEAGARLLPEVKASASHMLRSYNFLTGGLDFQGMDPRIPYYSMQDIRLSVEYPLFAPTASKARAAAGEGVRARSAERESLREDAALRGALAWVELSRAQALERDREEALSLARDLERMALDQKASGSANGLDVLRAQSQVVSSERALSMARYAREKASFNLARELGWSGGDTLVAAGHLSMEAAKPVVRKDSVVARVRAAEAGRRAALGEAEVAKAKFLPVVALAADYGYSGDHGWSEKTLTKDGEFTGEVGVFLKWSVWDGGGDDARLAQARERERQAALNASEARRQSKLDLDDALKLLERTREQLDLAAKQSVLVDSQLVLARERFKEGGSGNLEVVQAQAERNAAHAAWIEAAGAHQAALARDRWAEGNWDGF